MPNQEILPPVLSKSDTKTLEKQAQRHYSRAQIDIVLFAADLARLQEGRAHKVRGYGQFGKYAESIFEGLTSNNAMQIVRQGVVLLKLERSERIRLEADEPNLPGTTGLRELSVIAKRFGDEIMLQTWDQTVAIGGKVTGERVLAALGTFIQAAEPTLQLEQESSEIEDEPYGEYNEDISEIERELIDRIRDLSYELPDSLPDLEQAVKALKAEQAKADTTEDDNWTESAR
jgi:hypothetical protein